MYRPGSSLSKAK